jgi:C-terminal processing protease CtpA/Prc
MAPSMWFMAATLAITATTAGAEPASDRDARRIALAKVWLEVKVAHPAVARGQVDPDAAMPAAIAKVDAATTKQAYAAAIQELLAPLHDPVTFVEDTSAQPAPPRATAGWIEHPTPSIAVVTPLALATEPPARRAELFAKLPAELGGAEILVVDLRAPGMEALVADLGDRLQAVLPHADHGLIVREVVHHGYRTQDGWTSGDYDSGLFDRAEAPPQAGGKARLALMLQASGKATIVAPEPLHDTASWIGVRHVELPYGLVAHVRCEEVMLPDGSTIGADVVAPAPRSPHDAAIELAKAIAGGARPPAHRPGPHLVAPGPVVVDDKDWPESPYPSRELRIFAGLKAWGVITKFYPYLDLPNEWDAELPHALAALEAAPDAGAYRDALMAYGTHLHDGHIWISRKDQKRGSPSIEARIVQGTPIITRVWEPGAQVKLGDEIVAIGGVPIAKAREAQLRLTSGATQSARDNSALEHLFIGEPDVPVELDVRGADGKLRRGSLPRHPPAWPPAGEHYRPIGKLGYVDLRELTPDEVDATFRRFAQAPALILDLRGYPNGTAWPITPHLNVKRETRGALFAQPLVEQGSTDRRTQHIQPLVQDPAIQPYTGKVIVLIDDRAVSQAEHSCLFFEQATRVTFIGTHTHGTNGDITAIRLPGGWRMWFTGRAVRHADGRQLQQVGIQPTIIAEPTIAGVRAGKDEVLDRAIRFATTGR